MNKPEIELTTKEIKFLLKYKKTAHRSLREYNRVTIFLLFHKGQKESDIVFFLDVE